MKYQIYLNQKTSETVNRLAEKGGKKQASFLKEFLEAFFRIYEATENQLEKEVLANGNKQPKIF